MTSVLLMERSLLLPDGVRMSDSRQKRYLELAKRESEKSSFKRFKMGAVLVSKGRVIGKGYNRNTTHPKLGSGYSKTMHCEGSAIQSALKQGINPSGSTLYIYRRNNNLAKPCKDCYNLLVEFGIDTVVYTSNDGQIKINL